MAMTISLYIGKRKRKDRICEKELSKFVEGDRSDRIKDLILKGLLYEGRADIPKEILEARYESYSPQVEVVAEEKSVSKTSKKFNSDTKPDFSNIKVTKKTITDDELESRI